MSFSPARFPGLCLILLLAAAGCLAADYRVSKPGSSAPVDPVLIDFGQPRRVPVIDTTPRTTVFGSSREWWLMPPDRGLPANEFLAALYQRLDLGTRITTFSLSSGGYTIEDGSGFIGNVRNLQEVQNHSPFKLFIDFWFNPYLGVDLAFDGLEVQAVNENNGESDGTLEMSGPLLSLTGRYPNTTRFVPYAGIGLALWSADFRNETWWHLGYPDPETWEADGKPKTRTGGRRRTISAEDGTGLLFYLGVACHITANWSADLMFRTMSLSSDVNYVRTENGSLSEDINGTFPLDNTALGFGVRYSF